MDCSNSMNIQTLLKIHQIDEYTNEKGKNPYLKTINRNGMWAAKVGGLESPDWTTTARK